MALILKKHLTSFNFVLALYLLLSLILYSPEALELQEENQLQRILVPYILISSFYRTILTTIFVLICCLVSLRYNKVNILEDRMMVFMLCRLLIGILQIGILSTIGVSIKYGNYYLYLLELLLYAACLKTFTDWNNTRSYLLVIKFFVFIVAVETIVQSVLVVMPQVPYVSLWYKANMNIPIGSSNSLSALLLPVTVAEMFRNDKKRWYGHLLLVLAIIAIILTKSRFAMFILFLVFCKSYIINKKNALAILFGILVLIAFLYFMIRHFEEFMIVMAGYSDEISSGGTMNKLSSGRLADVTSYFDVILNHPIIGFGPNYVKSRAHNIIVDLIYQNGIVGLVLFLSAVTFLIKRFKKIKPISLASSQLYYVKMVFLTFLVQSLGEISFFTDFYCDLMFLPCVAILAAGLKKRNTILNLRNAHVGKLSES